MSSVAEPRGVQVQWQEDRTPRLGPQERFFLRGTRTPYGVWCWEERRPGESAYSPVAPGLWGDCRQKANSLLSQPIDSPAHPAPGEFEFGDAKDNEAVLDRARYLIAMGRVEQGLHLLMLLEDHIVTSPDPKNNSLILPVRQARSEAERATEAKLRDVSGVNPAVKPANVRGSLHRLKADLVDASVLLAASGYAVGLADSELHDIAPTLFGTPVAPSPLGIAVAAVLLGIALYVVRSRSG